MAKIVGMNGGNQPPKQPKIDLTQAKEMVCTNDTSLIDLNLDDSVSIVNYGAGTVCGGSVHSFKGNPYRSFEGGSL